MGVSIPIAQLPEIQDAIRKGEKHTAKLVNRARRLHACLGVGQSDLVRSRQGYRVVAKVEVSKAPKHQSSVGGGCDLWCKAPAYAERVCALHPGVIAKLGYDPDFPGGKRVNYWYFSTRDAAKAMVDTCLLPVHLNPFHPPAA